MKINSISKFLASCLLFVLTPSVVLADNVIQGYGVNISIEEFINTAKNKFALSNTKAAHNDFLNLIDDADDKDFLLLNHAIILAEYGFFDLTDKIFSKIEDYEISQNYINNIKNFYYPAKRMGQEDLLYLAEAYSNIKYNNYAQETVLDIINNGSLFKTQNDYTYYILSLGFFETKDYNQALNYITLATSQNGNNINYKILKIKILLELNQIKKAAKILEEIKKQEIVVPVLKNEILALEQYFLYKTVKNEKQKDYHLGYYYFLEDKISFSQKVLLNGLSTNKKINGEIYGLLSETYLKTDLKQAEEFARKSLKCGVFNASAYYTLGQIKQRENSFKQSSKLFNKASVLNKETPRAKIELAKNLKSRGKYKQAKKMWQEISKKYPNSAIAYYNLSKFTPENKEELLKKALSYNVEFISAYFDLAEIYINRDNYKLAEQYLRNAKNIDENDFRYYYYFSRLELQRGNNAKAQELLEICKSLEPNYQNLIDRDKQFEK